MANIYCPKCKGSHIVRETRTTLTEAHNNDSEWEWVTLYHRLLDPFYVFICQTCHHEWHKGKSVLMNKE